METSAYLRRCLVSEIHELANVYRHGYTQMKNDSTQTTDLRFRSCCEILKGVVCEISTSSDSKVTSSFGTMLDYKSSDESPEVDTSLDNLVSNTSGIYNYEGSLTTPPSTERVTSVLDPEEVRGLYPSRVSRFWTQIDSIISSRVLPRIAVVSLWSTSTFGSRTMKAAKVLPHLTMMASAASAAASGKRVETNIGVVLDLDPGDKFQNLVIDSDSAHAEKGTDAK